MLENVPIRDMHVHHNLFNSANTLFQASVTLKRSPSSVVTFIDGNPELVVIKLVCRGKL